MKITITIKNCISNRECNIQVDNGQKIGTTIRVLEDNMADIMEGLSDNVKVKSQRTKRRIDLSRNYEHEMIFSGDILLLCSE